MSGTLTTTPGGYFVRYVIGSGKQRKGALLTSCKTEAEALKRKDAIGALVDRLRDAGHTGVLPRLIQEAAAADAEGFAAIRKAAAVILAGKAPGLSGAGGLRKDGMTVEELAAAWSSGELAKSYPDHVRVKKSSKDDARIFAWLNKVRMPDGTTFGARPVASVTLDDCDHLMGHLPETTRTAAARRQYAQAIRKLLVYGRYPLRLRQDIPIPQGWLPKNRSDAAKSYVYPSEDLALMQCREVPLARRLFFGFLAREGMRTGEALGLTWADVDLVRGVVRLDTNKTEDPRSWALGEDVVRALGAWKKLRGAKATKVPAIFPKALLGDRGDYAHHLREGLALAGVDRPELTKPKAGRLLLRAHDLRGSFVTLALASGRTEAWVTDRTGHKSSVMIYRYKRASRTAAELGLGWFAPLDEAIPELHPKGGTGGRRPVPMGVPMGGAPPSSALASATTPGRVSRGGPSGTRTRDLRIKSPQLYQLSYQPGEASPYYHGLPAG